jgi:hypothetical protein
LVRFDSELSVPHELSFDRFEIDEAVYEAAWSSIFHQRVEGDTWTDLICETGTQRRLFNVSCAPGTMKLLFIEATVLRPSF